jgi:hypothetical protein
VDFPLRRIRRPAALLGLAASLAVTACSAAPAEQNTSLSAEIGKRAAACDHEPAGPSTAPPGAVVIRPGDRQDLGVKTQDSPAGTTFWLTPGKHVLERDEYNSISPKNGDRYIGASGAILDGRGANRYAFVSMATNVTISNLTVRGFAAPANEGVVNHDSGDGWVIEHNTIENNRGAGLMAGARQQVRGNCLRDNGQYGMNAVKSDDSITGLVVEGNEIVGNNTEDWESKVEGCGCTGGVKFWAVNGATIRNNWVHDNRGAGLWADTNNNDFLIENNVIEKNDSSAIFYETSYNAIIRNNLIRENNWVDGKEFADRGDTFPAATIYLSEAGGEPRIPARTDKIDVYGNVLQDNWSGITLWENADRFCNSTANTSTGSCTRLVPKVSECAQPGIATEPLRSDCRWRTKRVDIHDNRFAFKPEVVGCEAMCGRMAILSNVGTSPEWSPYQDTVVQENITFHQDNRWHDNTYIGPWTFMPYDAGTLVDNTEWQSAPYDQDRGSTFAPEGG